MANTKRDESATREFFLDILHLMWMFTISGCKTPPDAFLDRKRYEAICKSQEAWRTKQLVRRLKEQKLAEIRVRGERVQIALTQHGKIEGLRMYILNTEKRLPRGEFCLVSFDVPEDVRRARWSLRHFLKAAKFERVHHSLWKTDKDVVMAMRLLVEAMGAKRWITVFCTRE